MLPPSEYAVSPCPHRVEIENPLHNKIPLNITVYYIICRRILFGFKFTRRFFCPYVVADVDGNVILNNQPY